MFATAGKQKDGQEALSGLPSNHYGVGKRGKMAICKNKSCGIKFIPTMPGQRTHDYKCAVELAKQEREKNQAKKEHTNRLIEKRKDSETRDRLKSRSEWLKEAQAVFNKFIRLRDGKEPCISCGRHHKGQYHAGHYRTVGACGELRFEEFNVHKQCAPCNDHLSGNIVSYRVGLIKKIGIKKVEWLEGKHEPKKYTIPEILGIKERYKLKVKEFNANSTR